MGLKNSKVSKLKQHELDEFAKITSLSVGEIHNLYTHFKAISAIEKDDGVIDYEEFCSALKIDKSLISDRIFQLFDANHDTVINFREFVTGISMLMQENIETQIKLTFNIFDADRTGHISADYVIKILQSSLDLLDNIFIPKEVLQKMVSSTFEDLNKDIEKEDKTKIDYQQYRKMVRANPLMLKWLYIDLQKMQSSAQLIMKNPKKYIKKYNIPAK